ncbi:MAG: DUF5916 domain-containing protein, partial [Thermoanaerobaculia bacterium]
RDLTANGVASNFYVLFRNYWESWAWAGGQADKIEDRATRGGPAMLWRGNRYVGGGGGSDARRKFSVQAETERWTNEFGSDGNYFWAQLTYRPTPAIRVSLSPTYRQSTEKVQYVTTIDDPSYTATFGKRYVFATLAQKTLDIGIRTEWTVSSRLSAQLYLQPFVASGDYSDYKTLTRPRDDEFTPVDVVYDAAANAYSGALAFDNPDFNFRSVRGSAVVRWEFRPGSAMYVVWSENRADVAPVGDFRFRRDFSALPNAPSQDVFLIKFSYWLPV